MTPKVALNDVFDFWYFRQPATNVFTETNYAGTSMLQPPGAATTTTTIHPPLTSFGLRPSTRIQR